ncbi:MAG: sigma-70 family RNA polymerase sigma factor [Candidatus Limnocylindrales bacterium]
MIGETEDPTGRATEPSDVPVPPTATPSREPGSIVTTGDGDAIEQLVARARDGDTAAFGRLYDLFAPRLYRYVRFRVREPTDAEDLVQRIFVRVIEALPRYEQRGLPFAAWIFRLAHNAVIDRARTARDHRTLDSIADRPADGPGPAELAARSADLAALEAAIHDLTPDQQQVIACRFFGGLSTAETAQVLGRREVAVRALQFRAIAALRRGLAGTVDFEGFGVEEAPE